MEQITLEKALSKLANRRAVYAAENNLYYADDHLQKGNNYKGYIGILPPQGDAERVFVLEWLERIFAAANLVKASVNRNLDGVLSREPDWSLVFPEVVTTEAQERLQTETTGQNGSILTWWNDTNAAEVVREAGKVALLEGECYIRPIVPIAVRDADGRIVYKKTLQEALDLLEFEVLAADKAGIFTDSETGQKFSVCHLKTDKTEEVEISWVGADGLTYLKILRDTDIKLFANQNFPTLVSYIAENNADSETFAQPIDLGGRLYLQKVSREVLITESARSLQRSVNYALTTMNKNLNVAGGRDTYVTNAQRPKKVLSQEVDGEGNVISETTEDAPLVKGASNANFIAGFPIYDATGKIITGYTQAGVTTIDPVVVDTFVKAFEVYRAAFLDEVYQAHILTNEQAALSGKSRQEARAEFEKSLKRSKLALDPAGRYILSVALHLAAAFTNRKDFLLTRFDFNCQVTAGAVDMEEVKQRALDVEKGRLSLFSYLVLAGSDDPDAELARMKASDGYDLIEFGKALEVYGKANNQISLRLAVEMSAMTDEGKNTVLEQLPK